MWFSRSQKKGKNLQWNIAFEKKETGPQLICTRQNNLNWKSMFTLIFKSFFFANNPTLQEERAANNSKLWQCVAEKPVEWIYVTWKSFILLLVQGVNKRKLCLGVELQTAVDSANAYDGNENTWKFYVEEVDDLFRRLLAKGNRSVLLFSWSWNVCLRIKSYILLFTSTLWNIIRHRVGRQVSLICIN